MASYTIRIPITLDKRRSRIKRIAALCAEEMSNMPLRAGRNDDLTFNWRLAGAAPGGEELMEVKVAVETQGIVGRVSGVGVNTGLFQTGDALRVGFWVERDAFERGIAVVAVEALGVEASFRGAVLRTTGCNDATGDWEGTARAGDCWDGVSRKPWETG